MEAYRLKAQNMTTDNVHSALISHDENEIVFSVLGEGRQSKATAVVQMFHALPPGSLQWTKYKTGVLCFVKDYTQRSYFLRLVDIPTKTIVFDQELYYDFVYKCPQPYFHTFAGDDFMVGLNFADAKEADHFTLVVNKAIAHNRQATKCVESPSLVQSHDDNISVCNDLFKKDRAKPTKPTGKKLSKTDISRPTNFMHLCHVGWDSKSGNFSSESINPEWKKLFETVGITEEQLKDRETAEFIYDFVEQRGGIEEATRQIASSSQAPPASSCQGSQSYTPTHTHCPRIKESTLEPSSYMGKHRTLPRRKAPPPPTRSKVQRHGPLALPRVHSTPTLSSAAGSGLGPDKVPTPPPKSGKLQNISKSTSQTLGVPVPPPTPISGLQAIPESMSQSPGVTNPPLPPPRELKPTSKPGSQPPGIPTPPPPPPIEKPGPAPSPPPPTRGLQPKPAPGSQSDGVGTRRQRAAPLPPPQRNKPCPSNMRPSSPIQDVIKNGAELNHSDIPIETTNNGRSDLMESIRQGINLKKVDTEPKHKVDCLKNKKVDTTKGLDGIAGALSRALEIRSIALQCSESEDSTDEDDWD